MNIGKFDRRITIEQKSVAQDATFCTEIITWNTLATVWANVQDVLPSRSEAVQQGLSAARNQTRIRIRYRSDVDSSMRITHNGTVYQIVGGPAEIGRQQYTEFVVERYSS